MSKALNRGYPTQYESRLTLKNGREVFLRPILPTDGDLLIGLFNRMSPQSIYSRFLWRLHTIPEDMIHRFTHIDYDHEFALAAVVKDNRQDAIIAVGRYLYDPEDKVTDLAVAVRDDWQHLGLGKSLLAKTVAIGKERGISRFKTMMDTQNKIISQILLELGYEVKYSLRSGFFEVDILV